MIVDPKAPADPARLRNATTVDTTGTGEEVLRLPPGAGLPELAESPPPDTLVKLQAVAGARPAPRVHTVVDLAIPYAGGPLPEEALSPPDGAVVGLIWKPDTPVLPEAQTADAADEAGMAEIAIPYEGGDLPDEADSPPEGTIVRLIDPGALPAGH